MDDMPFSQSDVQESLCFRSCLRPPFPEVALATNLLIRAEDAHVKGLFSEAEKLILRANIPAIAVWAESLIGKNSEFNTPLFREKYTVTQRTEKRMPTAEMVRAIHRRDGFCCGFCGTPVIRRTTRKRLVALYPNVVPWGPRNIDKHAAIFVMEAQYDHVIPFSIGGQNDLDNLLLTCLPCNYGRGGFTLEEMGLYNPLKDGRAACVVLDWDGLERLLKP